MLIRKVGEWRVESDGLLSPEEFREIGTLGDLERLRELEAARAASVGAERVRDLKRRAWRRGYEAGRAQAASDFVAREAAPVFAARCLEEHLVRIAMQALVQLVGELPTALTLPAQLRRCVLASRSQRVLSVRVAPDAVEHASRFVARVESELGAPLFSVLGDASLPVHSCVIETEHGLIDGGLKTQFGAIQQGMRIAMASVLREHAYIDGSLLKQIAAVEHDLRDVAALLCAPPRRVEASA
jgi:type III secretion protein L